MRDIKKLSHIHFVGIKGVGMTSLALCAQDLGIKITGSDVKEIFVTDETLKRRNIPWKVGFKKDNLRPIPDLVITTGAHGGFNNPEVVAAREAGIPVMSHAQALAEFAKGKDTIAVCGVGGKTTTTSIIATVLDRAGLHPSFAIGVGNIFSLGTPGRFDKTGSHFICEADEFVISPGIDNRPRFLLLTPKVLGVTNIEHDHPDVYPTIKDTFKAFASLFKKIPKDGLLVACVDNKNVRKILGEVSCPVQTYGVTVDAEWRIKSVGYGREKTNFSLYHGQKPFGDFTLLVPGRFNILNATATIVIANFLGTPVQSIKQGLLEFNGTRRRFEKIGQAGGVLIYDDYAHHPTEIKAVLKAAREWFPKRRILAVFQPHTYSRTKALLGEFAKAFSNADIACFMDIYASARENDDLEVSSLLLTKETSKYHKNAVYTGGHDATADWILRNAKIQDVVLTLGAGDIFHIHDKLLSKLHGRT